LPKVASFAGVGRDLQPIAAALVGLLGASSCGAAGAGTGSSTPAPAPAPTTTRSDPAPAPTTIPSGKAPIASTAFQLPGGAAMRIEAHAAGAILIVTVPGSSRGFANCRSLRLEVDGTSRDLASVRVRSRGGLSPSETLEGSVTVEVLAAIAESPEDAWFAACGRSFVLGSSQRARIAELLQSLGTPDRAP
jgi:hypothetical protein